MRDRVFVSYRRSDTRPSTNAVRQTLEGAFGEAVFVDTTDIRPGENFADRLGAELARTVVVVAVIGPSWLDVAGTDGRRRLDDPEDWVRIELTTALASPSVTVIPVLVDHAPQPTRSDLPESLHRLADLNSARVDHDSWDRDWDPVLDQIALLTGRARRETHSANQLPSGVNQQVEQGLAFGGDNNAPININFGND